MALLPIIEFPDPRLRIIAKPIAQVDDAMRQLIDDMFETMYEAPGIGLAATQINVHQQLLVLDISEDKSRRIAGSSMLRSRSAPKMEAQVGLLVPSPEIWLA